jgi:serine/threonine protein kinase
VACVTCAQHERFQSAPGSRVGTPAYLSPEVILTTKGKTYDGKVDQASTECTKQLDIIQKQSYTITEHYSEAKLQVVVQ